MTSTIASGLAAHGVDIVHVGEDSASSCQLGIFSAQTGKYSFCGEQEISPAAVRYGGRVISVRNARGRKRVPEGRADKINGALAAKTPSGGAYLPVPVVPFSSPPMASSIRASTPGDFDGISHLLDVAVKAALTERTHGYEHFGTRVHSFMEAILADLIRQFGIIGLYAAAGAAAAGVGAVMRHFTELKPGNSPEYGPRLFKEALSPCPHGRDRGRSRPYEWALTD